MMNTLFGSVDQLGNNSKQVGTCEKLLKPPRIYIYRSFHYSLWTSKLESFTKSIGFATGHFIWAFQPINSSEPILANLFHQGSIERMSKPRKLPNLWVKELKKHQEISTKNLPRTFPSFFKSLRGGEPTPEALFLITKALLGNSFDQIASQDIIKLISRTCLFKWLDVWTSMEISTSEKLL